jgi:hypothetical protein
MASIQEKFITIPEGRKWLGKVGDPVSLTALYLAIYRAALPVVQMGERCFLLKRTDLTAWHQRRVERRAERAARRLLKLAKAGNPGAQP